MTVGMWRIASRRLIDAGAVLGDELAQRMTRGSKGAAAEELFSHLRPRMKVSLRWVPPAPEHLTKNGKKRWGQERFRWLRCVVRDVDDEDGKFSLRVCDSQRSVILDLHACDLWNRVVFGHHTD